MKQTHLCLALLMLLAACGDATKITPTRYSALNGWREDAHAEALQVFAQSCTANATRNNAYRSRNEGAVGERAHWNRVCSIAQASEMSNDEARAFFEGNFTPYKVETEATNKGLHTGYYEPIINGSRTRKAPYLTPVYGVPSDLKKPYLTREQIVNGVIKGRAPVLLYVDDPVMLFFLHIQGSGKVRLPDGSLIGLQYAAQNGHEFVPIGRVMKERGILSEVSMQGIRDWLKANPREGKELMNTNPSYIFFKLAPGDEMAKGALGVPLTPLRSIAVDDDRAAYGVPTYLDTAMTRPQTTVQTPLQRLFISQDTGGALHGPHRADIFFGRGEQAEWQAGHQNARGDVYWLLPVAEGVTLRDGTAVKPQNDAAEVPPEATGSGPMKKPRILSPEERAIWRESNRHTTPFDRSIEEPTDEVSVTPVISNSTRPSTVKALPFNAPTLRPRAKAPLPELSQREANKRLKQHPKVDATLDLHGMTKLEAMEQVTRFITRQQQMGHRHVVIITGKGRGTAMGVLRAALPDWLNEPRMRPLISTITHARPEKGGEGVTHVLLKRP